MNGERGDETVGLLALCDVRWSWRALIDKVPCKPKIVFQRKCCSYVINSCIKNSLTVAEMVAQCYTSRIFAFDWECLSLTHFVSVISENRQK